MISAFNDLIARSLLFIATAASNFWQNVTVVDYSIPQVMIDILLVAILFYWIIRLISGTRAVNIIFGLIVLALIFLVSTTLELVAVSWLLRRLFTVLLVAIPIIFQQELRQGLERLGKTKFFLEQEAKERDFLMSEIIEACLMMAKHNIGALIVFRIDVVLTEYSASGVSLNAKVSKELLQSIFAKNAPLHDGAVIIDKDMIIAAGVTLPHSFKNYGHSFGTRHKAALAISEATDAKVIVISEERGKISLVEDGKIEQNVDAERLQKFLSIVYRYKKLKNKGLATSPSTLRKP